MVCMRDTDSVLCMRDTDSALCTRDTDSELCMRRPTVHCTLCMHMFMYMGKGSGNWMQIRSVVAKIIN